MLRLTMLGQLRLEASAQLSVLAACLLAELCDIVNLLRRSLYAKTLLHQRSPEQVIQSPNCLAHACTLLPRLLLY